MVPWRVLAWLLMLGITPAPSKVITTVVETFITETSTSIDTPYSMSTEKVEVVFTEDVPVETTTMVSGFSLFDESCLVLTMPFFFSKQYRGLQRTEAGAGLAREMEATTSTEFNESVGTRSDDRSTTRIALEPGEDDLDLFEETITTDTTITTTVSDGKPARLRGGGCLALMHRAIKFRADIDCDRDCLGISMTRSRSRAGERNKGLGRLSKFEK